MMTMDDDDDIRGKTRANCWVHTMSSNGDVALTILYQNSLSSRTDQHALGSTPKKSKRLSGS